MTMIRAAVGGTIVSAVLVAGMIGPAAAAETPSDPYELHYSSINSTVREFGAVTPDAARLPFAADTSTFDIRFVFSTDFTFCELLDGSGAVLAQQNEQNNEEDPTYFFPVPAGVITPGVGYDVECRHGYYFEDGATWHLVATAELPGPTTVLRQDSAALTRITNAEGFFDDSGTREDIHAGDAVRVVSPAGTWTPPGDRDRLSIALSSPALASDPVSIPGVVSADGSTVDFTMPSSLPFGYARGVEIRLRVAGTTAAAGGRPTSVQVTTLFAQTAPYTTTTATQLSLSAGTVALTKPRATVRVSTGDGTAAVGSVVVLGDGHPIARAVLSPADAGRIVIPLPRLSRGTHAITAVFSGADTQLTSTSAARSLRVRL